MKKRILFFLASAGIVVSCTQNLSDLGPATSLSGAKGPTATSTAQSIMIKVTKGTYSISGTNLYRYDEAVASTDSNTAVSSPTLDCNGSTANCASTNAPDVAPVAPAPNPTKMDAVLRDNKCKFLDGLALVGATWTQDVTVNGKNGRGNFIYTFTFTITPTQVTPVAPFTAWPLVESNTSSIPVSVLIAGESVAVGKQGTKYSFTLQNAEGSRVKNVMIGVDGQTPVAVEAPLTLNEDFMYDATSPYIFGTAQSSLKTGQTAASIVALNQYGSTTDGLAYAKTVPLLLSGIADGIHALKVTGTVKGNTADGTADVTFTVEGNITTVTPGCGGGPN